jgi:hypothetical protein
MRAQLVLLLVSIASANANFVFNTITTGPTLPSTISTAGGPEISGSGLGQDAGVAVQFSLSFDDTITQIDYVIATDGMSVITDHSVTLAVYSDNSGVPGSQIGTDSWSVTGANTLGLVQSIGVDFSVTANTLYWLVALPGDPGASTLWDQNGAGIGGNWTIASPIAEWRTPVDTTADPAFALEDGTPEPASGVLVLSAFTIAMLGRFWQNRAGKLNSR